MPVTTDETWKRLIPTARAMLIEPPLFLRRNDKPARLRDGRFVTLHERSAALPTPPHRFIVVGEPIEKTSQVILTPKIPR